MGARRSVRSADGSPTVTTLDLDAVLSGQVQWRPRQVAALYGLFSLSAATPYLWARAGLMASVLPLLRADRPVALWAGFEATSNGNFESRLLELGPLLELHLRELHSVLSARAAVTVEDGAPTFGVGLYCWY